MALVHLPQQVAHLADGVRHCEIEAEDYRSMMAALDARWPGLRAALEHNHAVVLDGDIIETPLLEAITPTTEVHFIARIGGG
ncbi:MAG: hypothetical protein VX766_12510 [Pseudomonadota bacterium]|nr:hypothetical protein [Pseudomonadota bacterium]